MSIYFGNNKIGKIYVGDTSIGKVYKGSELVYQKSAGLKLYCYNDNNVSAYQNVYAKYYVIGGQTTSNPWIGFMVSSDYSELGTAKITSITGNLGASGSKIKIENDSNDYSYIESTTVNNIALYIYRWIDSSTSWLPTTIYIYVMQNSTVNSIALMENANLSGTVVKCPDSIDNSQFKLWPSSNNHAYGYRYSTGDKTWTLNGLV